MNRTELFETTPISKAVTTLAVPTMLGMLVTVIYNMADTFFIGRTGDANQVAAVSVALPVFLLLMAVGNIFGIGGGSYISRLLGRREERKVKETSSFCFYACIAMGFLAMFLFLVFMDPILSVIGTSANTYDFTRTYLVIIAFGAPFVCLQSALGQIVRSEGASKQAMIGMMIGTVVNIILDPIMILSMEMGVAGAAWATIIGNACSVAYYLWYFFRCNTSLSVDPRDFSMKDGIFRNVLAIGIPVSINNMLMSLANIVLNRYAVQYGDSVVAAFGVVNKIVMIDVMLLLGLSQGVQPFIGYNYASKNYRRMNGSISFSIKVSIVMGVLFTVLAFAFGPTMIGIFINDPVVIDIGTRILQATLCIAPLLGLQFIFMNAFQAFGMAGYSLILSLCRQGLAFFPAVIIGNLLFGLDGIIWAQPIADVVSIVLATCLYLRTNRRLKREAIPLDTTA